MTHLLPPGLRFFIGYGRSPFFLRRRDTHIPAYLFHRLGGFSGGVSLAEPLLPASSLTRDTHIPRPRGGGAAGAIPAYPGAPRGRGSAAYLHTPARRVGVEAPHTYIPPQGGLENDAAFHQPPERTSHLAKRPIPSLVSRALVRRRQRWRPPLRRRAELVGRPHGEPASAVNDVHWPVIKSARGTP